MREDASFALAIIRWGWPKANAKKDRRCGSKTRGCWRRVDRSRMRSRLRRLTHKLVSQMRSSVDRDGERRKGRESDSLIFNVNDDVTEATTDDDSARRRDTEFSPCALYFFQPRSRKAPQERGKERERERERERKVRVTSVTTIGLRSQVPRIRTSDLLANNENHPVWEFCVTRTVGRYMGAFTQLLYSSNKSGGIIQDVPLPETQCSRASCTDSPRVSRAIIRFIRDKR